MTTGTAVEVQDLVALYGDRKMLDGVSLKVQPAEVRVILGGSGSGKTTLLKHCIGLLEPAAGRIEVLDQPLRELEGDARVALLRRIGVLFQYGALLGSRCASARAPSASRSPRACASSRARPRWGPPNWAALEIAAHSPARASRAGRPRRRWWPRRGGSWPPARSAPPAAGARARGPSHGRSGAWRVAGACRRRPRPWAHCSRAPADGRAPSAARG